MPTPLHLSRLRPAGSYAAVCCQAEAASGSVAGNKQPNGAPACRCLVTWRWPAGGLARLAATHPAVGQATGGGSPVAAVNHRWWPPRRRVSPQRHDLRL